jgi:hypothetical protein
MIKYNRILVPTSLSTIRLLQTEEASYIASDASALQFFVEEMVRRGAVQIAVDGYSSFFGAVNRFPDAFQQRIKKVDRKQRSVQKALAIMDPVLKEFSIECRKLSHMVLPPSTQPEIGVAAIRVTNTLQRFLLGLEYQLQVEIDLQATRESLDLLLNHTSTPQSRSHLATLQGILSHYEPTAITTVEVKGTPPGELLQHFARFVEDEHYRNFSGGSRLFGFPTRLERALVLVRRFAEKLVTQSPFKQMLDIGSESIKAATGIPLPDSELGRSLLKNQFLPPVISLREPSARAFALWEELKPPFIPLDSDQRELPSAYLTIDKE